MKRKVGKAEKRWITYFFVFLLSIFVLSGCSNNGGISRADDIDLDLTALSAVMLSAEMTNISRSPQDYLGQTIRIDGMYVNFNDGTSRYFHFVIFMDEAGCCEQGFEFRVNEDFGAPEELININADIQVTGVFQLCGESERDIYYLSVIELEVL